MVLSVIVTSYNSPKTLELCLESLAAQPEAGEMVVADCSRVNPGPELSRKFPNVKFLHFPERHSVPVLRWAAFCETHGDVVAAVEARCVPHGDWCALLAAAHLAHPDVPAIGGPVAPAEASSRRDLGMFFCEYGLYAPPVTEGNSVDLSGANLSYKRTALLALKDMLDAGSWETLIHDRWRRAGLSLRLSSATVVFHNSMPLGIALQQRFWYGWGYSADRMATRSRAASFLFAAASPMLPFLLTRRLWRAAKQKHLTSPFRGALGWTFLFQSAWAAGECCGYLFGRLRRERVF